MTPERWQQIEALFQVAVEQEPARRGAFLAQACGEDAALRAEVKSLLAQEQADSFIQAQVKGVAREFTAQQDELTGQHIGVYRIGERLGEGGMGVVYAAVRDDAQFEKQVALKVVKRGMDTEFVLKRFWRERQILARLEHPCIARLLDGGMTGDGRPYFVMEYVEGQPITAYCQARGLGVPERLKLFRQVCAAVQYAHQQLVVHRDLKPSNILVAPAPDSRPDGPEDQVGLPKLLDFGIAKLLAAADDADPQTQTATELRLLTPEYASPEQMRGQTLTTTTDVYSLGVVLYELLTGQRPHQFNTRATAAVEHAVATAPPKPSEAVSPTGAPKLPKQLAGDLDNIVLMALRAEPERRYQSVEQFSEDLRRYLAGLPVTARADTFTYRASKFVRRNRLGLAAALLVLLSLLGGIGVATYQARRAEQRFQQVRKLANTFLFDFHDKIQHLPGSTEARELLVKTALEYLDSLARDASRDAALERELAVAYQRVGDVQGDPFTFSLGHSEAAMESYQKSLTLARQQFARDPANREVRHILADGYFKLGVLQSENGDKVSGLQTLQQAVSVGEPLAQQTGNDRDLVTIENAYDRIGDIQLDSGDPAHALESYRHTQQLTTKRAAEHPSDKAQYAVGACYSHISETLAAMGDLAGALQSYQQSSAINAVLVEQFPDNAFYRRALLVSEGWVGNFYGNPFYPNQGDRQAARQHYERALALAEALAAGDPKNAASQMDLANAQARLGTLAADGDAKAAVQSYRRALAVIQALLEKSPNEFRFLRRQANYWRSLAVPLLRLGDRAGALQTARQVLTLTETLVTRHPADPDLQNDLRAALHTLADCLLATGDHAAALEYYRRALTISETAANAHPASFYERWHLADSYANLGRYYATLAAQPQPAAQRLTHWRTAQQWQRQALAVWDNWLAAHPPNTFTQAQRAQAAQHLAHTEAALAQLTGSAVPGQ
ncbi:MAG: protein kinase [Acidobacteria bacterium]|nr:protein kinase [Acidobacteriota bacterium]MBI3424071.1 protein kinase [Acidobacteriota bacterium]